MQACTAPDYRCGRIRTQGYMIAIDIAGDKPYNYVIDKLMRL